MRKKRKPIDIHNQQRTPTLKPGENRTHYCETLFWIIRFDTLQFSLTQNLDVRNKCSFQGSQNASQKNPKKKDKQKKKNPEIFLAGRKQNLSASRQFRWWQDITIKIVVETLFHSFSDVSRTFQVGGGGTWGALSEFRRATSSADFRECSSNTQICSLAHCNSTNVQLYRGSWLHSLEVEVAQ